MASNNIPALTREQRIEALNKAKAARVARAEFKAEINEGFYTTEEALEKACADPALKRMRVLDFISAHVSYGTSKSEKLMRELGIAESRRLGGLSERQRAALIKALPF